jgi:hypothetical protein
MAPGSDVPLPQAWPRGSSRALYGFELTVNVDALIDWLVASVNSGRRQPKSGNEVPPGLRTIPVNDSWFDWKIAPSSRVDWIESLEARLPARLPRSFRSLANRYEYPAFSLGPILLFANTAEHVDYELRDEIWKDKGLSDILQQNGLLHFGRPATGSYDPICFQAGERTGSQEYEVVRVDHEEILCNSRIRITERIARSFFHFVEAQLKAGTPYN